MRWRIVDVRAYDTCRLVTLAGVAPPYAGIERRLLDPFDTIEAIDRPPVPRIVSASRWRAACRDLIAGDTPPGSLRQGRSARIDLMVHQLEPALAVLAGRGTRVLLADEVGLGKTIQAGVLLAELQARAWIDRVLVLTPAGLRDQWIHELSSRFAIKASGVDGKALRHLAATLPIGMNPWAAVTFAVASLDYVKRAEVLPAVSSCRWDAVVVDEAHGAVGDSDRRAAVQALTSRASYVVLLTATPHSGDRAAFAALCALGSVGDDRLLLFRRSRADIRINSCRRIHTLRVRLSPAESAMHAALDRYSTAVRAELGHGSYLALSVLHKRAFSSPWSLAQSVARRLAALERDPTTPDVQQMALPLDDPDGERTRADEPPEWPSDLALADPVRDWRLLGALLQTCHEAAGEDRKLSALRRLLRRANEPAIVFTEYRDTLLHVQRALKGFVPIVPLHGGMTREERNAALDEFERHGRTVLLATDAAGEGLNLQRGCRLVVNLELPWNPMRLEQRIGRVDRIGQTRTVHAVHLVAEGTGELRILDRLHDRVARAQTDVGAPDPIGDWLVVPDQSVAESSELELNLAKPDFRGAASAEVARLERARAIVTGARAAGEPMSLQYLSGHGPLVVRARRAKLRFALGTKALLLWQVSWDNPVGNAMESRVVAVTIDNLPKQTTPARMKRIVGELADRLAPAIESMSCNWRDASAAAIRTIVDTRLVRERAILVRTGDVAPGQFQPGLFDRRAERLRHLVRQEAAESERQISERIALVERAASICPRPPALLLAVLP